MYIGKTVRFTQKEIYPLIEWMFEILVFATNAKIIDNVFYAIMDVVIMKRPLSKHRFMKLKIAGNDWLNHKMPAMKNQKGNYYRLRYNPKNNEEKARGRIVWNSLLDESVRETADLEFSGRYQMVIDKLRGAGVEQSDLIIFSKYLQSVGCSCVPDEMTDDYRNFRVVSDNTLLKLAG